MEAVLGVHPESLVLSTPSNTGKSQEATASFVNPWPSGAVVCRAQHMPWAHLPPIHGDEVLTVEHAHTS
ncbi:MAG: hypothetical protein ACPIOQ_82755 [Promethearchaeia archaeon]